VEIEGNKNNKIMEKHLYECLYDILKANFAEADKLPALKKYKAKIIQLHARRSAKIILETHTKDRMDDEDPSLYHVLKLHIRSDTPVITQIQDSDGTTHTTFRDIRATFVQHLAQKFRRLEVDLRPQIQSVQHIPPLDQQTYEAHLKSPITTDEVHRALRAGARRKTPGIDGICVEFYITHRTSIQAELRQLLNDMFLKNTVPSNRSEGFSYTFQRPNKALPMTPTDT
jgi:hypothetical protein